MKISYVQWVETDESQHHAEFPPCYSTTKEWIRIRPPARAWRNKISGSKSESLNVIDERGQFHAVSSWKKCSLNPSVQPVITSEQLVRESLAPDLVSEERSAKVALKQPWIVSEAILNGKKVKRHEIEIIRGNFLVKQIILAHPRTRRLIRKERTEINLSDGRQTQRTVFDRYIYNHRPPKRTFEMPKGKRIVVQDASAANGDEWASLPEKRKQELLAVITRLNHGWRDSNFRRFASVWKFDKVPKAPKSSDWKLLIKQNRGLWSDWNQEVRNMYTRDFVVRRIGSSTFTFASRKKTLHVEVILTATSATTGKVWRGRAEIFLQFFRTNKRRATISLRVVHWDLPLFEILSSANPQIAADQIKKAFSTMSSTG